MNETEKPFACCEKDCEMTFTNEDHLNWHQKKHDMILNLGLTKTNDVADQTPTPTRFIRNCEEVGLFQDLQNVNPFDEFFKKAVETTKNGGTLEVPETNSDDTLHTPHILPHIEGNRKNVNTSQDDNNSRSNEFSLNSVIPMENVCTNEDNEKKCDSTPVIVIDDESDPEKDIKKRIKEALQNKEKQRTEKENFTSTANNNTISVVPFQNLIVREKEKPKTTTDKSNGTVIDESKEKIREMNRAAQIRCRKRKQIRWKEMEEEIMILKNENKRLRIENFSLQRQLLQAKKTLDSNKVTQISTPAQVLPQILPKLNNATSPIVIQILPGTSNAAIPATNNLVPNVKLEHISKSVSDSNTDGVLKIKKNLRKIIPKIIIEN